MLNNNFVKPSAQITLKTNTKPFNPPLASPTPGQPTGIAKKFASTPRPSTVSVPIKTNLFTFKRSGPSSFLKIAIYRVVDATTASPLTRFD